MLKAHIDESSDLNTIPDDGDGNLAISSLLSINATPAFVVWKTSVAESEIFNNGMDWARVDNLSVGKSRIWEWMFKFGSINPSKTNVRSGIDATWVGTAPDLAVRAAVYVHCKRPATRGEKLFATGTGSDAVPGTLVIEGAISASDVETARNLP